MYRNIIQIKYKLKAVYYNRQYFVRGLRSDSKMIINCYSVESVTKTFTLKGVRTMNRWSCWKVDSLCCSKCKCFRNTHDTITFGIPLQSCFLKHPVLGFLHMQYSKMYGIADNGVAKRGWYHFYITRNNVPWIMIQRWKRTAGKGETLMTHCTSITLHTQRIDPQNPTRLPYENDFLSILS
jgi:hypothetical protein